MTPNNRDNLAALISGSYVDGKPRLRGPGAARPDGDPGPGAGASADDQQRRRSGSELTLLSDSNQAQVQYGNLLSLPVGDGMLYVEPVYVKSNQENAVPLLQKVLMSYGDGGTYVVLANNLKDGLKQLVEQGKAAGATATARRTPPPPPSDNPRHAEPRRDADPPPALTGDLAAAAAEVEQAIAEVKAAQASGDFERYGRR